MLIFWRTLTHRNGLKVSKRLSTYLTRYIDESELCTDHFEKKLRFLRKPGQEMPQAQRLRIGLHVNDRRTLDRYTSSSAKDRGAAYREGAGRVDVVRLRHIAAQLRVGRYQLGANLGDDFLALCQVLPLFSKDFEQAHSFVDHCLVNWFDSLEVLMVERSGPGYLLAGVLVTLSNLDKLTHGECTKKLGFRKIERLGSYILEDRLKFNAVNFSQLVQALYHAYKPVALSHVRSEKFSDEFLQKLVDYLPFYLKLFEKHYKIDDSVRFDLAGVLYRLCFVLAPRPNIETVEKLAKFFTNDMRLLAHKNVPAENVYKYLFHINAITKKYFPGEIDFLYSWCNLMISTLKRVGFDSLPNTRFSPLLLRSFLTHALNSRCYDLLAKDQKLIFDWMDQSIKFLKLHELFELIDFIQRVDTGGSSTFDKRKFLEKLTNCRVTCFGMKE